MFSVIILLLLTTHGLFGQDISGTTTTSPFEELSTVVCDTCLCEEGLVDCSSRGLRMIFSVEEWEGLKYTNVTELSMTGNAIQTLTVFPELSIAVLNLSDSKIEYIDDECFRNLQDLATLDLSRNLLLTLHRKALWGLSLPEHRFRTFVKMKRLSLAHNELHTLPKETFGSMQNLVALDLSWNPLRIIDQLVMGSLSDLIYLRELNLSGCELEALPEGLLRRQRRLNRLDISHNKFKVIPAVLSEAVNLLSLTFDGNPISTLSEETAISSLTKLQELSICSSTRLQFIGSGALGYLESLQVLRICNNPRLGSIDDDFLTWHDDLDVEMRPLLKELYLHNNNLTEIDPDFLFRWDQLQKMDFSDNPFVCDCSNQWMVDVLIPFMRGINGSAQDMICNKPQELRGMSFAQLNRDSKTLPCPVQDVTQAATPDIAIILGVMIGIFVTFPLVLIVVLLWKKGYFTRCREKLNGDSDSEEENGRL